MENDSITDGNHCFAVPIIASLAIAIEEVFLDFQYLEPPNSVELVSVVSSPQLQGSTTKKVGKAAQGHFHCYWIRYFGSSILRCRIY